ncbi:hypothetical protein RYX36_028496, partial [Vicia faba]
MCPIDTDGMVIQPNSFYAFHRYSYHLSFYKLTFTAYVLSPSSLSFNRLLTLNFIGLPISLSSLSFDFDFHLVFVVS